MITEKKIKSGYNRRDDRGAGFKSRLLHRAGTAAEEERGSCRRKTIRPGGLPGILYNIPYSVTKSGALSVSFSEFCLGRTKDTGKEFIRPWAHPFRKRLMVFFSFTLEVQRKDPLYAEEKVPE